MRAIAGAVVCAAFVSSCVVYDMEPYPEPFAIAQATKAVPLYGKVRKPNLLFVVDRSGSMEEPVDPSLAACLDSSGRVCGRGGAMRCTSACPTRWTDLQRALEDFLTREGEIAQMGLLLFPRPGPLTASVAEQCAAPGLDTSVGLAVPIPQTQDTPAELRASADHVAQAIRAESSRPGGGTPTGETLRLLQGYPPLNAQDGRADLVVLLTDGLPNCNFANPAPVCQCVSPPCTGETERAGCLDDDGTVRAVTELKQRNISTAVVGFGSTVGNPQGVAVLNRVAEEGGLRRTCATSSDCGAGDVCTAGSCGRKFYQAANANELVGALDDIAGRIPTSPCEVPLDALPSKPEYVSVAVDGAILLTGENTWRYEQQGAQGKVVFVGEWCTRIQDTVEANALNVRVRVLETL